ncbi:MAG: hypothetical protein IPH12_06240 [Saprospirales bacterium]|nr:hypothetical protein [Saprospirales bacterium]
MLRSQISGALQLILAITGLMLVACAVAAILIATSTNAPADGVVRFFQFVWIFPMGILLLLLRGYYRIHIAGNRVQLRNLFGNLAFDLPDVTGYAAVSERGGEILVLALRDRPRGIRLMAQYYRNYPALKAALTGAAVPSVELENHLQRQRQGNIVALLLAALLLAGAVQFFLHLEYKKPPLAAADLQRLEGILATGPEMQSGTRGSGTSRSAYTRLVLELREQPGRTFRLEGAALEATRTGALLEALRPGDSARLWVKKTAIERPGPSGYVDVYALEGRDAGYLSLDEYNIQHKSTQARHIRLLWWSILGMALFTGWRYWVYRHTGYAYSGAVI